MASVLVVAIDPVLGDCTVTVNFALNEYTLDYLAGPGGTIVSPTPQTVLHGTDGSLVAAEPSTNHTFVQWSDGNTNPLRTDSNVTDNLTVTAEFAPSVDPVFAD